ncbi:MAG: hypothetical protein LBQ76_09145 [Candidatus Fibromonas sp.]|jgi:hypothetical protein|nr:hypothetical protein [Candidatus Fibromonas sp.]
MQEELPRPSPIRALEHNITFHFEQKNKSFCNRVLEEIKNGNIEPHFNYEIGSKIIQSPFVICKEKTIQIQERFLEFMWAFIYSHWVKFEEGQMKYELNIKYGEKNEIDMTVIKRASLLRYWAFSLLNELTDWDIQLPNPNPKAYAYMSEKEKIYAEKVNTIFLDAIGILLWHEASHIINCHCEEMIKIKEKTNDKTTEQDKNFILVCEKEADNQALEILMNEETDQPQRMLKGVSILMAFISPLFLVKGPEKINQVYHPDLDVRLGNVLEFVGITDQVCEYYLYRFGCIILDEYFVMNSTLFQNLKIYKPNTLVETAKDLFYEYLDRIELLKRSLKNT